MVLSDSFVWLIMFFLGLFFLFYVTIEPVVTDSMLKLLLQSIFLIVAFLSLTEAFFEFGE